MNEVGGQETVFGAYASFYDVLYADKDYEAECDFVASVLADHSVMPPASILDLGCGTGGHVIPLAVRGFSVTGADRSEAMITVAKAKASAHPGLDAGFVVGDVRDLALNRRFDAVISMFAVVSYQLTNADLLATFTTARSHLEPGGVFLFDSWFGPAVLVEQPEVKTKVVTGPDGRTVTRVARPELDPVAHTVTVSYDVTSSQSDAEVVEHATEAHTVRFLFVQEIAYLLEATGFRLEAIGPFMDFSRQPNTSDWNISVLAVAR